VKNPKPHFAPELGDMKAEDFRRLGHQLIDWIVDYFEKINDLPVLAPVEPGDLKAKLPWELLKRAVAVASLIYIWRTHEPNSSTQPCRIGVLLCTGQRANTRLEKLFERRALV